MNTIGRVQSLSRVRLSAASPLELRQCFAGLDALVPRVTQLGVTSTSAVSEPRTAATAATAFAGSPDDAAFGADGNDGRLLGCWCLHV